MANFTNIKHNLILRVPRKLRFLVADETAIKAEFYRAFGYELNLQQPQTLYEKSNWIKLYDRNPLMTQCSDKYAVRDFVTARVGSHILNELHGVYESADAINFDTLPEKCILKVTNGSGWNVTVNGEKLIVHKKPVSTSRARKRLKKWMHKNQYIRRREWCYKNIRPKIICEKWMESETGSLTDYKIHCFSGRPHLIQVIVDRYTDCRQIFYDTNWKKLDVNIASYPLSEKEILAPDCLNQMLEIARVLSSDFPLVRVDLYDFNGQPVFGELSFHAEGGFGGFSPPSWDLEFGKLINLSSEK